MITIRHATNGFIVENEVEGENYVYGEEAEDVQELLYDILTMIGHTGSRYDAKRVYVKVEPGDKYELVSPIT